MRSPSSRHSGLFDKILTPPRDSDNPLSGASMKGRPNAQYSQKPSGEYARGDNVWNCHVDLAGVDGDESGNEVRS